MDKGRGEKSGSESAMTCAIPTGRCRTFVSPSTTRRGIVAEESAKIFGPPITTLGTGTGCVVDCSVDEAVTVSSLTTAAEFLDCSRHA